MIEAQMKEVFAKQAKISARKMHYFAIASMVGVQMENLKELMAVKDHMAERLERDGDDSLPDFLIRETAQKVLLNLTPMYQICYSLKAYRQAFGEYPEWAKFIDGKGSIDDAKLEKWVEGGISTFMNANSVLGKMKGSKMRLLDVAFGETFQKISELIKLRGED